MSVLATADWCLTTRRSPFGPGTAHFTFGLVAAARVGVGRAQRQECDGPPNCPASRRAGQARLFPYLAGLEPEPRVPDGGVRGRFPCASARLLRSDHAPAADDDRGSRAPDVTLVRGPGEARVCRAVDHTLGARPKRKRADRGPARWRAALRWTPDGADIDTRPGLPLRHSVGVGRGDQAYPALLLVPLLIFRGAPARAVRGRAELAGGLDCGRTAGNRGVRRLAPRRPRSHE